MTFEEALKKYEELPQDKKNLIDMQIELSSFDGQPIPDWIKTRFAEMVQSYSQ